MNCIYLDCYYPTLRIALHTHGLHLFYHIAGVRFKEGEFSAEWLEWIDDNLLRGVDPGKIVAILASKGFHPHKNTKLMHRILTWNSLEAFMHAHPDLDLTSASVDLDEDFFDWITDTVNKGVSFCVYGFIYLLLRLVFGAL